MLIVLNLAFAQSLSLSGEVWFAEDDVSISRPGSQLELKAGYLFGVQVDDAPAGFVFVGEGQLQWAFGDEAHAMRVVNVMESAGQLSPTAAVSVLDAQTWTDRIDVALVISEDASALSGTLRKVTKQTGVVGYVGKDGQFEVVVTDYKLGAARRRATDALAHRQVLLSELGLDPAQAVRLDRLEDGDRWVIDVHHDRSWRPLLDGSYRAQRTQWTTWIEDQSGAVDEGHRAVVLATGVTKAAYVESQGSPLEEAVVRRLTAHEGRVGGTQIDHIVANVLATPGPSGRHTDLAVESLVTLSTDRPSEVVVLHVPCTVQQSFYADPPIATSCEVGAVAAADGDDLVYMGAAFGRFSGNYSGGVYRLPKPLLPGQSLKLRVSHTDRVRSDHRLDMGEETHRRGMSDSGMTGGDAKGGIPEFIQFGRVSEAVAVLPYRPGQMPPTSDVRLGVVAPFDGSVSGSREQVVVKGDVAWSKASSREPMVQVGRWQDGSWQALAGMPAIRTRTLGRGTPGTEVFLRAAIHFYTTVLPPFPHQELELVEGPGQLGWLYGGDPLPLPTVRAAPGQLQMRGIQSIGDAGKVMQSSHPKAMELAVAQGIAAQWWLEPDYPSDDAWIGRVMPRVYRQLYLEEAYGKKVVDPWARVNAVSSASLQQQGLVPPVSEGIGPAELNRGAALFTGLVRGRIGERAMLKGFHNFLQKDVATTRGLQHELEAAGGRALDDVFQIWLAGGYVPEGMGTWSLEDQERTLVLDLNIDLPHGRLEVPVRVRSGRTETLHWVELLDGQGSWRHTFDDSVREVEVDPYGWLPMPSWELERAAGVPRAAEQQPQRARPPIQADDRRLGG